MIGAGVEHRQPPPAALTWDFDEHLVAGLGDVDRYQRDLGWRRLVRGHGRSVSPVKVAHPSL